MSEHDSTHPMIPLCYTETEEDRVTDLQYTDDDIRTDYS